MRCVACLLAVVLQLTPPSGLSIQDTPDVAFGDLVQTAVLDSSGSATVQTTFASGVTTGNLIVAVAYCADATLTVAGDLLSAIQNDDATTDNGLEIGYRVVQSGDGDTWGFTQPSADQFALILREFEGPWEASPLDQTGTTAHGADPSPQTVTAAGGTAQADELVVAGWGFAEGVEQSSAVNAVSDSFVSLLNEHNNLGTAFQISVATAFKVLTATGTPSTAATWLPNAGVNLRAGAVLATFKKEAGGAPAAVLSPPSFMRLGVQ